MLNIPWNKRYFLKNRRLNKWLGFVFALSIVLITILVSNNLVSQLKLEEQKKMETIVSALELNGSAMEISDKTKKLIIKISSDNTSMPMILIDENGNFSEGKNLGQNAERLSTDSLYLANKLFQMAKQHKPIEIELPFGKQFIYYENSSLLSKLQYYPLILILIIVLFVFFTIWYFRTLDATQRSFLWAGMAKETAHQIGTPLSSLLGWIEILKMDKVDSTAISEMENDVNRLNQIADRFSKIGSKPELKPHNIVEICSGTYQYLLKRVSSGIDFTFKHEKDDIIIDCNPQLLSWVLENLTKNAVDALQNRGNLEIKIEETDNNVLLSIEDSGSGIPYNLQKRIFEPGYTTKKRGWGLGLSLAKRIINDYHKGKIYVAYSEKNKGTKFVIELRKPKVN